MELIFSPDRTSLTVGIFVCLVLAVVSAWYVYRFEVKKEFKEKLKGYKPLVSMLCFFTAFISFGIMAFNIWNFSSLKTIEIADDYILLKGEKLQWGDILSVDNKLIDEVGLFGNIKATDERVLEIRRTQKGLAPVMISEHFYDVEAIYKAIKSKKDQPRG